MAAPLVCFNQHFIGNDIELLLRLALDIVSPGAAKDAFAPGADVVVVPVSRAPLPATAAGEGSAAGNA